MSSYKVKIPYTPKPKVTVKLGGSSWYNPSARGMLKTREYVKSQLPQDMKLLKGPVLVICHFKIPAPLSLPERKRVLQNYLPHTKRPDGDNLEKFLNDSLNGILWEDDCKISWELRSKSITSDREGSTIVFVRELPEGKPDYLQLLNDIKENISLEQ